MALESEGSSAVVSESVSTSESPAASSASSGYSVTDPGYESEDSPESVVDELAALKAENTPNKPSSTEDDASDTDGETEEATEETQTTDETAESNDISDELLDRAAELGYTVEELKGFRSDKSLAKDIARVESLQKRFEERQGKKPAEETPVEDPEPNWDEMIEEGHDPANVAIQKKLWQRASSAEALVKQVYQAEQTREFNAQCERFDETLNKLDGFEKILGSGRKDEIAKASPDQAANRQKVFTTMQILKRGYEEAGVKVPAEAELIEAAAMASFPKHVQQTARTKLKSDIKKAGSQALSRPHSTAAKPLSGATLAMAKEADFWKKHS